MLGRPGQAMMSDGLRPEMTSDPGFITDDVSELNHWVFQNQNP